MTAPNQRNNWLTALPFLVGWALVALARSHAVMLAGRAVAGLAVGLSAAPAQVLISEVAEPRNRGALAGTPMVSYSLGILCVYALGSALPWRVVAWLGTALPLLALAALSLVPESPTWLVRRGRLPQASRALRWLRGGTVAAPLAQREFEQLVARLRSEETQGEAEAEAEAATAPRPPEGCLRAFSRPDVYKPFFIVVTLNIMQIFSGTYLVIFYAVDLLEKANAGMDEALAAVLTAAVRVVFTAVACGLLSWTGRRALALSSGLASGLAAVAMGSALYVRDNDAQGQGSDPYAAIVVGCLLVYMAANTCGFFVLPLITIGELLPAKVRGLAGGYIFASFNLALFAATKVFPSVTSEIGAHGVFWVFGIASLTGTVFIYLALPETKGQSLAQIEDYFRGKNFLWVTRHKYRSPEAPKV
ncbi:Facilitated trehalose transporter Tret1-2 homolog [Gryllus bimaculatus]|nr:Facilitated trehalose transporter Tret1-2 homolog [Gryllus bimaculatus]